MSITKQEFYRAKGLTYKLDDPEATIRYKRMMKWLDPKPNAVVREIGCKFAVIRDFLSQMGTSYDYLGLDIDQATLEKMPDYDPKLFLCHDVNQGMPFADHSVDYIICLEVLEHLENATYFFNEVRRALKPEGRLILSVPNPYCWSEYLQNMLRHPDDQGHIASYTLQNIDALLRFSNLRLVDWQGTFTRIPLTSRFFGRYKLLEADRMFLTRSYMFLIGSK